MKIKTSLIKVNDRIRMDFGDIERLAQDIKENGLINPILITKEYELIAGERRLRAIKLLGWDEIDVTVMTVRDALHKLKLEISENEYRKDFCFREKVEWSKLLEMEYSKLAKENMSKGGKGDKILETFDKNKTIAQEVGFGNKETYRQAKFIYENADDDTLNALDEGKATINGVYKKLNAKPKNKSTSTKTGERNEYACENGYEKADEYCRSRDIENETLKQRIKQLERDKEQLSKQKDAEISKYRAMYENERRSKEQYKNIASMFGGSSVGLDKSEYRKLVKVCHPDAGGSDELMNIISKLYQK